MLEEIKMKLLMEIVEKKKNKKPTNQVILWYPTINEWVERRRGEWDEHVTRIDADILLKISKGIIPAGRSPGCPKGRWGDLIAG